MPRAPRTTEKAPGDALAGTVLQDRITLVRAIASGGMADIYLARQRSLAGFEKDVVVKLLKERFRHDSRVVRMFQLEARIGAVLNHANVVHVYDVGEIDHAPYIVMEYIDGEELSQLCGRALEGGAFLPFPHAVDLVRQTAQALGYFHSKHAEDGVALGIVHRDIGPTNILVTADGVAKVIDFGIATASFPDFPVRAETGLLPGKVNYMSPEQARGETVNLRSDIYSLGIVLYEITVGRRLFRGQPEEVRARIAAGKVKPPTFVRHSFPAGLERIVLRALELHPDDRYQTAYDLAYDLEDFIHDAHLRSGPVRIAQYLEQLGEAIGEDTRPELLRAGRAWLDDNRDDALDFERSFTDPNRRAVTPPPPEPGPAAPPEPLAPPALRAPVPQPAPPAPAPAPPPAGHVVNAGPAPGHVDMPIWLLILVLIALALVTVVALR